MAISLKDQLLKAGVANAKQARQADHAKRQAAKGKVDGPSAAELAQQKRQELAERDREANRQLQLAQQEKAIAAQIRQLIEVHRIARGSDIGWQFLDARKVKKLLVSTLQQDQLVRGVLAVVRLGEGYELVPAAIAGKIAQRDPACIVCLNARSTTTVVEDDPYADYPIPDDLMW